MPTLDPSRLLRLLFGRPLSSDEEEHNSIGVWRGIPVLGLDALASASYGPEAALTVFALAGTAGLSHIVPLTLLIVAILLIVQFSYRQTIATHPSGGGSYTVAKENLGTLPGLLAGSALFLDYVLNVAVAISAGVGALVSVVPALLPHTLGLCLGVLLLLTLVNLRGVREAGAVFFLPTWLFVLSLGGTLGWGLWKMVQSGGAPQPVVAPPAHGLATAASTWLVVRAFSSGCTAMTGIEAVSNAVPIFRQPKTKEGQRTLSGIVTILALLLVGIGLLARAYGVVATEPGRPGYQSILSQLVAAVAGRGALYYVTIGSVMAVLSLSANTSFAGFPRLCRMLAEDEFLPEAFSRQGRRLVYTAGILVLSLFAALLLVAFGGVTDRLIPLFAIGAFSAFTLSQAGMVAYWWRRQRRVTHSLVVNAVGAVVTAATLLVVLATKFTEGAWLSLLLLGGAMTLLLKTRRHYERVHREVAEQGPLELQPPEPPLVVVPLRHLDGVTRKALRFALSISPEVYAVEVRAQSVETEDLRACWRPLVEEPVRAQGLPAPRLVTLRSEFRDVGDPLLRFVRKLARTHPTRHVAVIVPEVVARRWYHFLLHSHTATALRLMLFFRGGPQVVLIDAPWYLADPEERRFEQEETRRRWSARPAAKAPPVEGPPGTVH